MTVVRFHAVEFNRTGSEDAWSTYTDITTHFTNTEGNLNVEGRPVQGKGWTKQMDNLWDSSDCC